MKNSKNFGEWISLTAAINILSINYSIMKIKMVIFDGQKPFHLILDLAEPSVGFLFHTAIH